MLASLLLVHLDCSGLDGLVSMSRQLVRRYVSRFFNDMTRDYGRCLFLRRVLLLLLSLLPDEARNLNVYLV